MTWAHATFEWDEHNLEHIARHGVSDDEVEAASTDPCRVPFSAHSGHLGLIGKTTSGRVLVVILARRGGGRWRPVTARDASPREKRSYRRRTKR
ncbi:BrnT family toxin [Truepera radiovictrix]|uniref:BrnT family toxin n=1 Tax=Truepera radiovictrix (strain DSM 17093 / CIP 108686 / LMG 22925 / RQ-24) TaxID=649638 RepID=D7CRF8_TRURR|nr:BrnT family toxin [Truepera radiovictrix]ADI15246.1 protein of unknown function DUF497 [Truepera radiovictrix DSM 17093]WMT56202.1 BrnT family toxin [Truepera radiovictrix]